VIFFRFLDVFILRLAVLVLLYLCCVLLCCVVLVAILSVVLLSCRWCYVALVLRLAFLVFSHLVIFCFVKLQMQGNDLSPLCFNDACFLLHHGFDPRLWDDATRRAFVTNAHRRCPSSHCLLKDAVDLEKVGVEECRNHSQTTRLRDKTTTTHDETKSTLTHPTSTAVVMSRSPIQCDMQGSIAVSLQDKWVPCMTIGLTDGLADVLGTELLYSNGEEYYRTEWPIVTGTLQ
jgi:hypothetical protein